MPKTLMWGERGLVATFFLDLHADTDADAARALCRWKQFLRMVSFGGEEVPSNRLAWDNLVDVWAVVEPGFGAKGFGSPDLVARLDFKDNSRAVILLEAKLSTYDEACWLPAMRGQQGFNSKLNGQLELNHCLTLALANYHPDDHQLIDPVWVLHTPYLAARPHGRRRRLADPIVRHQLVEPLINLGVTTYLHVLVTHDAENPLANGGAGHVLPEIFREGEQGDQWQNEANRFGWINWRTLLALAQGWPGARFPDNLDFNLGHAAGDVPGGGDAPPANAAAVLPHGWPPARPTRGVSLVFAPAINNHTFLHFSWLRDGCCLRDYTQLPLQPDYTHTTMQVLALKMHEELCGPIRHPVAAEVEWQAIINGINGRYGV